MRRRPDVEVYLKGTPLEPGGTLLVDAKLKSQSETPCDSVTILLEGFEKRYKRTRRSGKSSVRVYHRRTIVALASTFPGTTLGVGEHRYQASFPLGRDLPPSFLSSYSQIWYVLTVHVAIPWWPDRRARFDVPVIAPRRQPATPASVRYETTPGPVGRDLYVEASLARPDVAQDGVIEGVFSLSNVTHNRLKRVEVSAYAVETARVQSTAGPHEHIETAAISFPPPGDGQTVPFAFRLPPGWPADFSSAFIDVTTAVRVRGVIGFGSDAILNVPMPVIRPAKRDSETGSVALLGSEKKVRIWNTVTNELAQLGHAVLETDPKTGRLRFTAHGIPTDLVVEGGDKRGERLVATLDQPDLGLGLRITRRGFTDFGGVELAGDPGRTFVAEGRDPVQIQAFLDPLICDALTRFAEVGGSDATFVVASPGSPHKQSVVRGFLHSVLDLAAKLDRAIARLPPPTAFAPFLDAYRAFASEREAIFRPGDMSLRHLFFAGLEAGVDHRFDGARCVATVAWLSTKTPLVEADFASLRSTLGRLVEQRGEHLEVTLPQVVDPALLVPLWETCREVVRVRSGEKARGPYRT